MPPLTVGVVVLYLKQTVVAYFDGTAAAVSSGRGFEANADIAIDWSATGAVAGGAEGAAQDPSVGHKVEVDVDVLGGFGGRRRQGGLLLGDGVLSSRVLRV